MLKDENSTVVRGISSNTVLDLSSSTPGEKEKPLLSKKLLNASYDGEDKAGATMEKQHAENMFDPNSS